MKKLNKIIVLILLFCAFYQNNSWSQDEGMFDYISYSEKIYVHLDRSMYSVGEDIWYKIYLVDGDTHKPEALSKMVYVDLINPINDVVDSKIIKIDQGVGEGDFTLPLNLINGQYTVRAYTNYMRNFDNAYFFRKKIYVSSLKLYNTEIKDSRSKKIGEFDSGGVVVDPKPDVQFFPEGGYLVNSFINRVGFKAVGIDGKGIQITGIIVDEAGKKVTTISSSKFGMGDFSFIPNEGKSYKAEIIYKNIKISYNLPVALSKGVVMNVSEFRENYRIFLQSSLPEGTKNLEVTGSKNGEVICRANIQENRGKMMVNILKSNLESGIVQFTVSDNSGSLLCERLVFVEKKENEANVNISSNKKEYGKREFVKLEISMDTLNKKTAQANISIAITDMRLAKKDSLGLDIKSHLLLNSELKGEIEQPGYYFYSDDPRRKRNFDLLMMCQGWRQFIWKKVQDNSEQQIKYPIEQGFSFTGTIKKNFYQNKSEPVIVSILFRNEEEFGMDEMLANNNGYFNFGDYDINDSTSITIQAHNAKTKIVNLKESTKSKKKNYLITLDTFVRPEVKIRPLVLYDKVENNIVHLEERSKSVENKESVFAVTDDHIKLEEVELVGIGLKKYDKHVKGKQLYSVPSQRVDFAELGKSTRGNLLVNLDGRVAGLITTYVGGESFTYFTRIGQTGDRPPLYLVDGLPVSEGIIKTIPLYDILFVDVLRGAKAIASFGFEGAWGVIAVYIKDGSQVKKAGNKKNKGIINFIHPGYSQVRKFYAPVYMSKEVNQENPDYRRTIYWKPTERLNKQGKATISFRSGDRATNYRVAMEGVTLDGIPILSEMFLKIK